MKKVKQRSPAMRFRQTLLSRYLLIILFAFLFIPILFPIASIIYVVIQENTNASDENFLKYGSSSELAAMWHEQASQLQETDAALIDRTLQQLKQTYPEASLFWVDSAGQTRLQLPPQKQLKVQWSAADAIQFMKASINQDPFTVVSFFGPDHSETGFMVLQLPRSIIQMDRPLGTGTPLYIAFLIMMFAFFFLVSLLFFRSIRKRLLSMQAAMSLHGDNGLPQPIILKKQDEIGQLEMAFNDMVVQLQESKEREYEEEQLRKQLISSLSHDLRTPLTVMNGHLYSLEKETLSPSGQASVKQMGQKIASIDSLIENLLSYTLMTSGRYPLSLTEQDVLRILRESAASWYPLWEQAGIAAEIELPDEPMLHAVDKAALRRVFDNLFQNIIRHAASGAYIGLSVELFQQRCAIVIRDRGRGLEAESASKGYGIGLAIVDYLLKEMKLDWHTESSSEGTSIFIFV